MRLFLNDLRQIRARKGVNRRRDEARTQEEELGRVSEKQRDESIAQQQRDLALAQQQMNGFNRAESLSRNQTLAQLIRANKILFNVNRGQYPITSDLKITPFWCQLITRC